MNRTGAVVGLLYKNIDKTIVVDMQSIVLRSEQEIMSRWDEKYDVPLVSVMCLAYNHEKYIEDALKGFLIQETDFPFEVLIHDDASTDRTADIIREYEKKYPHIIKPIYQKENQYSLGIKPTWRYNYPRANGQYIAFCEGDDYWVDEKKLQKQVDFMKKNPEYVICFGESQPFNEKGLLDHDFGGARKDLSSEELMKGTPIFTHTTLFRKVVKEMPPEFDFAGYGDKALWSVLGTYGKGKYLNNIKPSMYRVHDSGVHSGASWRMKNEMNLRTYCMQIAYFTRIGMDDIAEYHRIQMMKNQFSVERINYKLLPLFVILSRAIVPFLWIKRNLSFINKGVVNKLDAVLLAGRNQDNEQ